MSANIAKKGPQSSLILYNRTTARATAHAATLDGKATVANTIAEAVQGADVIFTCVGDDAALDAVVAGTLADQSDLSSKTFVDCSTVHPDTSRRVEAA
jgi:3-hydroxyisobutyrate dehydrogenase-like beta-hydroxyacid dehydrogenase